MVQLGELSPWLSFTLICTLAVALAGIVTVALVVVIRLLGGRRAWSSMLRSRIRLPVLALLLSVLLWAAFTTTLPVRDALTVVNHVFLVAVILSASWLFGSVALYLEDLALSRYKIDGSDGWQARRARTQFLIVRRLTTVVTVIIAIGAALLTLPGVQAIGTTMLASAGLLSVVAGLAAQSTLSNVFAGMQLAFSGSVRVEDVVVVEGEWGYIEEITLTYVVVRIWDERRLVMPSTYFTQQSYENWTRHSTAILGTVFFDLDWGVDVSRMRAELNRILAASPQWDGQSSSLRVTDTAGGFVQIRALVSASDADTMFDLCRTVREEMVLWLQRHNPEALPRTRIEAAASESTSDHASFTKPSARSRGAATASHPPGQREGHESPDSHGTFESHEEHVAPSN